MRRSPGGGASREPHRPDEAPGRGSVAEPRSPLPRSASPSCGPVLTRTWWRLPLARSTRASRGRGPFCSRRTLSHRLVGWCGDHFRGLQAEGSPNDNAVRGGAGQPEGRACGEARRRASGGAEGDGVSVNLETLYGAISDGAIAVRIPKHARKELEAYLGCGLLCRGFARLLCEQCGESRLVAFSCKGRGYAELRIAGVSARRAWGGG